MCTPLPHSPADLIRLPKSRFALLGHRMLRACALIALATLVLISVPAAGAEQAKKAVAGWLEEVKLYPGEVRVHAKLDTGATISSLDCACITPYERDGAKWVRFSVKGVDGKIVELERKVLRTVKIKRHFGEMQERMVVRLGMCLADQYREVDVTLVDRTGFDYPLLVGRNFLRGRFIVDPGAKFTTQPGCLDAPTS